MHKKFTENNACMYWTRSRRPKPVHMHMSHKDNMQSWVQYYQCMMSDFKHFDALNPLSLKVSHTQSALLLLHFWDAQGVFSVPIHIILNYGTCYPHYTTWPSQWATCYAAIWAGLTAKWSAGSLWWIYLVESLSADNRSCSLVEMQ